MLWTQTIPHTFKHLLMITSFFLHFTEIIVVCYWIYEPIQTWTLKASQVHKSFVVQLQMNYELSIHFPILSIKWAEQSSDGYQETNMAAFWTVVKTSLVMFHEFL